MNEEQNQPNPNKVKMIVREILIFALIAFGIVLPFRLFVAEPYIVDGPSMDPTFTTGDYLIVNKIAYELGEPERNTVTVFKYPHDTSKNFIKRIIGLPGDTLTINGNTVTITNADNPQGFVLDQSYVTHPMPSNATVTLGPGEYFVMGDNRLESFDSRSWGVVPRSDMIGRPLLRLLPITHAGFWPGTDKKK